MIVLITCVCASHVCLVYVEVKRALDALELELKMVIHHHVGAGKGTCVLSKNKPSKLLSHLFCR